MDFSETVRLLIGQGTRTGVYRFDYGELKGFVDPRAHIGETGPGTYVCVKPDQVCIYSEPAKLLEQLHASATDAERRAFPEILTPLLTRENARVLARTLAATGHIPSMSAIESADAIEEEFWRGVIHTLRFEPHFFSGPDLALVEGIAERSRNGQRRRAVAEVARIAELKAAASFPIAPSRAPVGGRSTSYRIAPVALDPVFDELKSVVERVKYLRVAKAIRENQSPTVDVDRRVLLSRLQAMGFSQALADTSDKIEQRAAVAADETEFKTVMDLIRTFLEEFVEEASRRIESKVGRPAPDAVTANHYKPYKDYLENAGIIGRDESALLQSLYSFLSNSGAHKLESAPEQLQVARVTVIEWCMMVAGRVQKFLAA